MPERSTKDNDGRARTSIVIGSEGMIGRALVASARTRKENVWGSTKNANNLDEQTFRLDLSETNIVHQLNPDFIQALNGDRITCFMCAAISGFNECVQNPELSYRVNVRNTLEIAEFFVQRGANFVFLSSNTVFDGTQSHCTEEYPTSPTTLYGRQKALVEEGLLRIQTRYKGAIKIIRLTKVLSKKLPLINEWLERLKINQPIYPYDNLIFSPVSLKNVVQVLRDIGLDSSKKYPILHITGQQDITYYNFALKLAEYLKVNLNLVQKNHMKLETTPNTYVPSYSALGMLMDRPFFGNGAQSIDSVIQDLFEEDDDESSVGC